MESIKKISDRYFDLLKERSKKTRVYSAHQLTGLALAGLLEDFKYKSLYMRLAKTYDSDALLQLAKTVSENKKAYNKGAYFMKLLKENKIPKLP